MRTIAFFNNKGGVGKTTLVYHIAWMMMELGQKVLAADLGPRRLIFRVCFWMKSAWKCSGRRRNKSIKVFCPASHQF